MFVWENFEPGTDKYGKYWRMNEGIYDVGIYFMNSGEYSCQNAFPIEIGQKTYSKKAFIEEIIKDAVRPFNQLDFGVKFKIDETPYFTDKDDAFEPSAAPKLIYFHNWTYGGLTFPFKNRVGIKMNLTDSQGRKWLFDCVQHELLHALGFLHKDERFSFVVNKDIGTIGKGDGDELNDDTIHGIDVLYNQKTPYRICGQLANPGDFSAKEAFIINDNGKFKYQTPIDAAGYFEFRLRKPVKGCNIKIIAKKSDSNMITYHYSDLKSIDLTKGTEDLKTVSLDRTTNDVNKAVSA